MTEGNKEDSSSEKSIYTTFKTGPARLPGFEDPKKPEKQFRVIKPSVITDMSQGIVPESLQRDIDKPTPPRGKIHSRSRR